MPVWGIVVAAGSGTRFGAPKQFLTLNGTRLVDRAVATAVTVCDAVVVVLPHGEEWTGPRVAAAVTGGATRSESVRAGLASVATDADVIVVHDAARPLASSALFAAVVAAVQTPQAFRAEILRSVHARGAEATDDAALVEQSGGVVVVVAGDPRNVKITGSTDLALAIALATEVVHP
jgi:2-C-methyl-D-erythritol 4-phosphate cytidylyltransferase